MRNNFENLRDELENDNCHTDALIVDALELCMYDMVKELASIAEQHQEAGHLTTELGLRHDEIARGLKVAKESE